MNYLHHVYNNFIWFWYDLPCLLQVFMPPIYDDYIDESGFWRISTLGTNDPTILEGVESYSNNYESGYGEVMTLFSDESTISEEVSIDYDNRVAIYDSYGDEMYAILNNDNHETCHHGFNFQSGDSYFVQFAPTTIHENKFGYVESKKISVLMHHEKNALCDSYIIEFIHYSTENYDERGTYASTYLKNINVPLYVWKFWSFACFAFLC